MIKSFKLFEELKRKAPEGWEIGTTFEPYNPETVRFVKEEIKMLQAEDFEVNGKIAVCKEKYCTYEIEKSSPDEYSICYELRIKDNEGKVIKSKKFKADPLTAGKMLDAILNLCAVYNREEFSKAYKDIDPYGEEEWEEKDKPADKKREFPNVDAIMADVRRRAAEQQERERRRRQQQEVERQWQDLRNELEEAGVDWGDPNPNPRPARRGPIPPPMNDPIPPAPAEGEEQEEQEEEDRIHHKSFKDWIRSKFPGGRAPGF